jgi:hypothetical protein
MVEEINFYRNLVGKVLSFSFFFEKNNKMLLKTVKDFLNCPILSLLIEY